MKLARARVVREKGLGACPQWLEEEFRAALHRDACGILERFFSDPELFPDEEPARPMEKRYSGRPLTVQTLFGAVRLQRRYYHHLPSHTGRFPLDDRLGLVGSFSPAVARMMCQASARSGADDVPGLRPQRLLCGSGTGFAPLRRGRDRDARL